MNMLIKGSTSAAEDGKIYDILASKLSAGDVFNDAQIALASGSLSGMDYVNKLLK